jgi:hypothetical protein
MPIVPFTRQDPSQSPLLNIDPTFLAMAAATMHSIGRLFEPDPIDTRDNPIIAPSDGGRAKDVMTPDHMKSQKEPAPPESIYNDQGQVIDIDTTPRKKR